jgi:flagellar basal-body rod protein FlgC
MSIDAILADTRFGLAYQRLRLEAAGHNIAAAETPLQPGQLARQLRVAAAPGTAFGPHVGIVEGGEQAMPVLAAEAADTRFVRAPGDPAADSSGRVAYAKIDLVQQMSTLIEAERAYEANVRAFNTLRSMTLRALDIGSGS